MWREDPEMQAIRQAILDHPVYAHVTDLEKIRRFMQLHVYAVWDFMTLLKALQGRLTGTSIPWAPQKDRHTVRFINQIVIDEESDDDGRGGFISHFELYQEAMDECGADTNAIDELVSVAHGGMEPALAFIARQSMDPALKDFLQFDLRLAQEGQTHEIAAAFFLSREDLIPSMFRPLVLSLKHQGAPVSRLLYYLNRHIGVDEDVHGPQAEKVLDSLVGTDMRRQHEARQVATEALFRRLMLWNAIDQSLTVHARP